MQFWNLCSPPYVKILQSSSRERGDIAVIIKAGGTGIRSSPALDLTAESFKGTDFLKIHRKTALNSYPAQTQKLPAYTVKNPGSIWEYLHTDCLNTWRCLKTTMKYLVRYFSRYHYLTLKKTGKENLAVFPMIIQTPRDILPEIRVHVDSKVKGTISGVLSA